MSLAPTVFEPFTDDAIFALLTINPPDGSDPLRVVNNNENVVSNGNTFYPYPFTIVLPADTGERQPQVQLQIGNVDQQITTLIREMIEPPTVMLELVVSSSPNTVERRIDFMRLRDVTYDAFTVQGVLQPINILTERFPNEEYLPSTFPDLFYS